MTEDEMRAALFMAGLSLDRADALLPTVRRIVAAELRAAADELHLNISGRQGLRDRAAALDGTA